MKPLDLTKPLQTRNGWPAELVYDGLSGPFPLAVVVYKGNGTADLHIYTREGKHNFMGDGSTGLMNVPQRGECWINIYPVCSGCSPSGHRTRERADEYARPNRIACVRVEYEEGEGL